MWGPQAGLQLGKMVLSKLAPPISGATAPDMICLNVVVLRSVVDILCAVFDFHQSGCDKFPGALPAPPETGRAVGCLIL